jgi:pimeloyl-ACP methyl ester carboxylesterase
MKKQIKIVFYLSVVVFVSSLFITPAKGADVCAEGEQSTGSKFQIYMPTHVPYNNCFIIWAHGFQDAGTEVEIPEGQLCFDGVCIPDIVVGLGCGFATNSYQKTGLAVIEGKQDILDLVHGLVGYSKDSYRKGEACEPIGPDGPEVVYIIGASEGGLITTLLAEENPDGVFNAAYALCGPIGDFILQINYFGDARATFEYFFRRKIPGYGIFNNIYKVENEYIMSDDWDDYFDNTIKRLLRQYPKKAQQWAKVAQLPRDPDNIDDPWSNSAKDVLRFSVVWPNLKDAEKVLKGFPYDNRWKWYSGSKNDFLLNLKVKRFRADSDAVDEMKDHYNTSGKLEIPLITMHTKRDQQVPYWHEIFYMLKTIKKGSFLKDHFNIPIDRYGHCNFTREEALGGFAMMLLYAGDWEMLSALETFMQAQQLEF